MSTPDTTLAIEPKVRLKDALQKAAQAGHTLSGFRDNAGVKVASCEMCGGHVIVDSANSELVSTIYPCDSRVNRLKATFAWSKEDEERYRAEWGRRNDVGVNHWPPTPGPSKARRTKSVPPPAKKA